MLIAITMLLIMWLGSGGVSEYFPKDFKKKLKSEVSDKQQQKDMKAIAKQVDKDVASYRKAIEKVAREELELNADYNADREEFVRLVDRIVGERELVQTKLLDGRFKLVGLMTEAQWDAVFGKN